MPQSRQQKRAMARETAQGRVARPSGPRDTIAILFAISTGLAIFLAVVHFGIVLDLIACAVVVGCLGYTAWNLGWVRDTKARRGIALAIVAVVGAGLAFRVVSAANPSVGDAIQIGQLEGGVNTTGGPSVVRANIPVTNLADDGELSACSNSRRVSSALTAGELAVVEAMVQKAARNNKRCGGSNPIARNEQQTFAIYDTAALSPLELAEWAGRSYWFVFSTVVTIKTPHGIWHKQICGFTAGDANYTHVCGARPG